LQSRGYRGYRRESEPLKRRMRKGERDEQGYKGRRRCVEEIVCIKFKGKQTEGKSGHYLI
jgi:hypothetical protein